LKVSIHICGLGLEDYSHMASYTEAGNADDAQLQPLSSLEVVLT
jgi:hypothetical protein